MNFIGAFEPSLPTVGFFILGIFIQENNYKRAHWDDDSESGSGSGSGSEDEECYIHADLDANEYLLKIDPGKDS